MRRINHEGRNVVDNCEETDDQVYVYYPPKNNLPLMLLFWIVELNAIAYQIHTTQFRNWESLYLIYSFYIVMHLIVVAILAIAGRKLTRLAGTMIVTSLLLVSLPELISCLNENQRYALGCLCTCPAMVMYPIILMLAVFVGISWETHHGLQKVK